MINGNSKSLEEVHKDSAEGQFTFPEIQWNLRFILQSLLKNASPHQSEELVLCHPGMSSYYGDMLNLSHSEPEMFLPVL